MIAEIPPIEVEGRVAVCDGRDGPDGPAALGHPRVYINLVRYLPVVENWFLASLLVSFRFKDFA